MEQYKDCSQKVKVLTNESFLELCCLYMKYVQYPYAKAIYIEDEYDFSDVHVTEAQLREFDFVIGGDTYSCVDMYVDDFYGKEIYFGDLIIK